VLRLKAGYWRPRADDRDSITASDSLISLISGGREGNFVWAEKSKYGEEELGHRILISKENRVKDKTNTKKTKDNINPLKSIVNDCPGCMEIMGLVQ
jgi:hypothetical protein